MATINWHTVFFLIFSLVACGFALAVVLSANVVRMAFYLVLSLSATAGIFFLAGADFVGSMQILIYVGGTLVLLVFGVMLTAQGPFISMKIRSGEWLLGMLAGSCLLALLVWAAFANPAWLPSGKAPAESTDVTAAPLGLALMGVRVDAIGATAEKSAGLSGYLLPFEIISVHLLVVLIGAAYLARPKRRFSPRGLDGENEEL